MNTIPLLLCVLACLVQAYAGDNPAHNICDMQKDCLPPQFTTITCSNGSVAWSVREDRNCDGQYDWITVRGCDGSLCSQPIQMVAHPIGTIAEQPFRVDFTSSRCENGRWLWRVDLYTQDSLLLGSVIQTCGDSLPQIVYASGLISHIPGDVSVARVSPNPTMGTVTITGDFDGRVSIEVYSSTGQSVHQSVWSSPGNERLTIELPSNLPDGIYIAVVRHKSNAQFIPFVLSR